VPLPECDQSSETAYFWYRKAIDTTDSIDHFGGINWRMLIALAIAWLVVWISVCKGIKTSRKVRALRVRTRLRNLRERLSGKLSASLRRYIIWDAAAARREG